MCLANLKGKERIIWRIIAVIQFPLPLIKKTKAVIFTRNVHWYAFILS